MRNNTDMFSIPKGFRYRRTYQTGKPVHDKFDAFSMRHPAMPLEKRAKIFSPCEDMDNAAYQTKGTYQIIQGIVSSVNAYVRTIRLEHGSMCIEIPLDDIIEIVSNVFKDL